MCWQVFDTTWKHGVLMKDLLCEHGGDLGSILVCNYILYLWSIVCWRGGATYELSEVYLHGMHFPTFGYLWSTYDLWITQQ